MASLKLKEIMCLLYTGLLFISGVLLIGTSVYLFYKIFYHFKFIPNDTIGPFIVYFLLGFIHLFLTWLGVKGPSREHDLHIILFIVITLVLLICECALGVWSVILWDEVDVKSLLLMQSSFNELLVNGFDKKPWESIQSELKCCGLVGANSYIQSIPLSCCDTDVENGTCAVLYKAGCTAPLGKYAKSVLIDGVIMGFSCCLFQALGVFVFSVFYRGLKAERNVRIQHRLAIQRSVSQDNSGGANSAPPSAPPV